MLGGSVSCFAMDCGKWDNREIFDEFPGVGVSEGVAGGGCGGGTALLKFSSVKRSWALWRSWMTSSMRRLMRSSYSSCMRLNRCSSPRTYAQMSSGFGSASRMLDPELRPWLDRLPGLELGPGGIDWWCSMLGPGPPPAGSEDRPGRG